MAQTVLADVDLRKGRKAACLFVAHPGHNGALQVTRNAQMLSLHAPKHKDIASVEDVLAIRRFLEQSGETAMSPSVVPGTHLLVVIDHHEAKIYRTELHGTVPQQLVPYDPHGFGRHLCSDTEETDGKRKPERKSFYEAVAATLQVRERRRRCPARSGRGHRAGSGAVLPAPCRSGAVPFGRRSGAERGRGGERAGPYRSFRRRHAPLHPSTFHNSPPSTSGMGRRCRSGMVRSASTPKR